MNKEFVVMLVLIGLALVLILQNTQDVSLIGKFNKDGISTEKGAGP